VAEGKLGKEENGMLKLTREDVRRIWGKEEKDTQKEKMAGQGKSKKGGRFKSKKHGKKNHKKR
jgi:hypothetical protein